MQVRSHDGDRAPPSATSMGQIVGQADRVRTSMTISDRRPGAVSGTSTTEAIERAVRGLLVDGIRRRLREVAATLRAIGARVPLTDITITVAAASGGHRPWSRNSDVDRIAAVLALERYRPQGPAWRTRPTRSRSR